MQPSRDYPAVAIRRTISDRCGRVEVKDISVAWRKAFWTACLLRLSGSDILLSSGCLSSCNFE